MNLRILLVIASLVASVLIGLALGSRGGREAQRPDDGVTIGLSLDTLKEARWQADRDMFVKRAEELGARVRTVVFLALRHVRLRRWAG